MTIDIPDSSTLPVSTRRKRKTNPTDRPMTQEERDTLQFEAIKVHFDWSNDEWAATWLPWVRLAAVHVGGDQDRLKQAMKELVDEGEVPNILEGLTRTKKHLESLDKLMDAALTRAFLVLERLGYSPDNPPPDSRVN